MFAECIFLYNCELGTTTKTINDSIDSFHRPQLQYALDALKNELLLQNWDDVMGSTDVNIAYDNFIKTFVNLYDKHCPVKKICSKVNGNKIKPWFTSGLRNACKKKNNLYRKFLQCRSKSAEEKYKVYKNKLTTILRNSEKNITAHF